MITVDVPAKLKASLAAGHPWIYRDQIGSEPEVPSGTWVRVRCAGFAAYGLWDSRNPIAVRIFSRQEVPDAAWVGERVREAWALRAPLRQQSTTGYRWVYGESDGLPAIVVDLYGDFAVIRSYVDSAEGLVPWVGDALHTHKRLQGIIWRRAAGDPGLLWGRPPPQDLTVEEHGLLFRADLTAGQKTGLFFDQRENRRYLADACSGKNVLDCFCYTGGFTLYALRAGAASVTACDSAGGAVGTAQENVALNGLEGEEHTYLVEDCFELLERFGRERRRFQVVILDPPSFAHDKTKRRAAIRAYTRLNRLALRCVEPGGLLASASCTSQVSPEAFRLALAEAARQAGRSLLILHEAGQGLDHPVPAHFPEARYLKFLVARVSKPC